MRERYVDVPQAHISEKQFLSARLEWNPQPSNDRYYALTIELSRLMTDRGADLIYILPVRHAQYVNNSVE